MDDLKIPDFLLRVPKVPTNTDVPPPGEHVPEVPKPGSPEPRIDAPARRRRRSKK